MLLLRHCNQLPRKRLKHCGLSMGSNRSMMLRFWSSNPCRGCWFCQLRMTCASNPPSIPRHTVSFSCFARKWMLPCNRRNDSPSENDGSLQGLYCHCGISQCYHLGNSCKGKRCSNRRQALAHSLAQHQMPLMYRNLVAEIQHFSVLQLGWMQSIALYWMRPFYCFWLYDVLIYLLIYLRSIFYLYYRKIHQNSYQYVQFSLFFNDYLINTFKFYQSAHSNSINNLK